MDRSEKKLTSYPPEIKKAECDYDYPWLRTGCAFAFLASSIFFAHLVCETVKERRRIDAFLADSSHVLHRDVLPHPVPYGKGQGIAAPPTLPFLLLHSKLHSASAFSNEEWKKVKVTTYGLRPSGRMYHGGTTANGERYDDRKFTVAVPPISRGSSKPRHPYGSELTFRLERNGKTREMTARVNDLCPGGTYDLTLRGLLYLLQEDHKVNWDAEMNKETLRKHMNRSAQAEMKQKVGK